MQQRLSDRLHIQPCTKIPQQQPVEQRCQSCSFENTALKLCHHCSFKKRQHRIRMGRSDGTKGALAGSTCCEERDVHVSRWKKEKKRVCWGGRYETWQHPAPRKGTSKRCTSGGGRVCGLCSSRCSCRGRSRGRASRETACPPARSCQARPQSFRI